MAEWSVHIETRRGTLPAHQIRDEIFDELVIEVMDNLAAHSAIVSGDRGGLDAQLSIDADTAAQALAAGQRALDKAVRKAGAPAWPVVRMEVVDADVFEAELAVPNFPDLVGTQEVTEMLDVSRQRVHELRRAGRFPEPIVQLASGPIWLRPAVEAFLEGWDRRAGRRPNVELHCQNCGHYGTAGSQAEADKRQAEHRHDVHSVSR